MPENFPYVTSYFEKHIAVLRDAFYIMVASATFALVRVLQTSMDVREALKLCFLVMLSPLA